MELIISIIKYTFVVALGVEALLVARALFNLARDKAREAKLPTPAAAGE